MSGGILTRFGVAPRYAPLVLRALVEHWRRALFGGREVAVPAAGVPVPVGRPAIDAEDACAAALEIGFPVVVKPKDGNQGKGVTVNITNQDQVRL